MATEANQLEDFIVIEDIDVGDESELRRVIATVESLVGVPGQGLRVSVLTAEQWETVLKRRLPRSLRRGAEHYFHVLKDPADPQHLLVSPSAVNGINEGSSHMYQELVYSALRCIPTDLSRSLRKGLDDMLAEECGKKIGVALFVRNYPIESEFVQSILGLLSSDFGYSTLDWAIMLRRNPERVFLALRKTKFAKQWLKKISEEKITSHPPDNDKLVDILVSDPLPVEDPLFILTEQLIASYLIENE